MSRQNLFLILLGFIYYYFFVNKGIVLYDEGYYFHIADRILQGQVPYKDFFLQFSPGYFYLLALVLKVFGEQILVGRFLTLFICLGIIYLTFLILDRFKVDIKFKILSFFAISSFGFPLINNMSLLAWIGVFLSILGVYSFILKNYILLAISLSFLLFTKQNLGIYFLIITNLFILFLVDNSLRTKLKPLLLINGIVLFLTLVWILYFFGIQSNFDKLIEFVGFNRRYLSVYPFSYPPLNMLFQPTGIFKLLPYYLPIIFSLILIKEFINKGKNVNILYFSTISLIGFFGTIYPTSDLLHVYPFFGMFLTSSLLFFYKNKLFRYWRVLVLILIATGFYLTFFKEYYRYQPRYRYQKTILDLPKTQNIFIDEPLALDLLTLNIFFTINTKKGDYILSYPFSPMLYFILDRKNPSYYSIYYPGYLTENQEKGVIGDIKNKNVRYIITRSEYKFNTVLSKFIQSQKQVYNQGQFKIFQVK